MNLSYPYLYYNGWKRHILKIYNFEKEEYIRTKADLKKKNNKIKLYKNGDYDYVLSFHENVGS